MKRITIMSCLALMSIGSWATEYYVSPTGSGSNYSKSSPGKLTSTVIGKLQAGDVLYLMGGQYDFQNALTINRSGTADKMITICPYNDERPILDFRQEANKTNGVKVGGSYLHIKGITIRYAGYKGIWLEESNIVSWSSWTYMAVATLVSNYAAVVITRSSTVTHTTTSTIRIMVAMPTALPINKETPALVMSISVVAHGTTPMTAGTLMDAPLMVHRQYISTASPTITVPPPLTSQNILVS